MWSVNLKNQLTETPPSKERIQHQTSEDVSLSLEVKHICSCLRVTYKHTHTYTHKNVHTHQISPPLTVGQKVTSLVVVLLRPELKPESEDKEPVFTFSHGVRCEIHLRALRWRDQLKGQHILVNVSFVGEARREQTGSVTFSRFSFCWLRRAQTVWLCRGQWTRAVDIYEHGDCTCWTEVLCVLNLMGLFFHSRENPETDSAKWYSAKLNVIIYTCDFPAGTRQKGHKEFSTLFYYHQCLYNPPEKAIL